LLGLSAGCRGCPSAPSEPPRDAGPALRVPHVTGEIALDGELAEADWAGAARTGPFTDAAGEAARPFSEARFLWDESALHVGLYAADDDVRGTDAGHDGPLWIGDAFSLKLSPDAPGAPTFLIDIAASGVTTDVRRDPKGARDASWESGIKVAIERDGSLDDPADEDEEWVVEASIPLHALGVAGAPGARIGVEVTRCDTPRGTTARRCGGWGEARSRQVIELRAR